MFEIIANMFGAIIRVIYDLTSDNYALSIILFTIVTKGLLFPLSLKQMKSSKEMQKVKPKYDEIMKKYKNDKAKQGEEITKLYAEHKINPLSGCLPALIQIPLVFAMFLIVRQPLTYVVQTPQEQIKIYTQEILQKEDVTTTDMSNSEILIANDKKIIDMEFLGLNLGDVPSDVIMNKSNNVNPLSLLFPIISFILSIYQMKQMSKNSELSEEQKQMQKTMTTMMPVLSGIISLTQPLALGLYWLVGSIVQILQQQLIANITSNDTKSNLLLNSEKGGKDNEKNN